MDEPMSCLKLSMKILAAIFALIFIVTLPFGFLVFFSANEIFNPEELTNTINESLIVSGVLRSSITDALSETEFVEDSDDEGEARRALNELTIEDWRRIVDIAISDEWLEKQIKEIVVSINTWLDDDRVSPGLEIDMRPIKAKMQGNELFEIINLIVDTWPTCTQEQVDQMQQSMVESGQAPVLYCEPPEPLRSELIDFAARRFQDFFREMPATFSIFKLDEQIQKPDDVLLLKERIRMIRAFTMGGWLLSVALLGLIMVLAIRSWRDVAIWWGIPIFVAGILTIALVFSANTFIDRVLQESTVEGSEALYDLMRLPISAVREKVSGEVMGMGLIICVVGMGILVISYLFHRAVRPAVEQRTGNLHYNDVATPPTYPGAGSEPPSAQDVEDGERPSGLFG